MKIKFDVEVTPEELRKLMGIPDFSPLQEEMMNQLKERLLSGTEGFDSMNLLKPILTESFQSFTGWQKLIKKVMTGGFSRETEVDLSENEPKIKEDEH